MREGNFPLGEDKHGNFGLKLGYLEDGLGFVRDEINIALESIAGEIEGMKPHPSEINYEEDNFAAGEREALSRAASRVRGMITQ